MSWSPNEPAPIIDRFLTNNTQIQLKILCREPSSNASVTRQLIKKKLYKLDKTVKDTSIKIRGRIGRVIGCLPLQSDVFISSTQVDTNAQKNIWQMFYEQLWKEMEQRTFTASQTDCDYTGTHLYIDEYSNIQKPKISPAQAMELREKQIRNNKNQRTRRATEDKLSPLVNSLRSNKNERTRRATEDESSPLVNGLRSSAGTLLTWGDGYYLIEIYTPDVSNSANNIPLDVDVIVSMKNDRGGYITADEHPSLVFYAVMCAIYALFAALWFIWCACYWRELLKIQFWIGGVILIGMIEKSAFVAEYDILNKNG
jgi:hypothetical protein